MVLTAFINTISALTLKFRDKHIKRQLPETIMRNRTFNDEQAAMDYFNYAEPENVDDAILKLNEVEMKRSKKQCVSFSV